MSLYYLKTSAYSDEVTFHGDETDTTWNQFHDKSHSQIVDITTSGQSLNTVHYSDTDSVNVRQVENIYF